MGRRERRERREWKEGSARRVPGGLFRRLFDTGPLACSEASSGTRFPLFPLFPLYPLYPLYPLSPFSALPVILLEARSLTKRYETARGSLEVLAGLDLEVRPGEMVAIVGESGSGKSTLLHLLGALDRPTAGEVRFREQDVFAQPDEALARWRNKAVGFVFQFHHLLPEFTALENVAMPALIGGASLREARPRAAELLERFGLADRSDHRPTQLSGGEQQRVAVARALMNKPGLVLADEPTGNLDTKTAEHLHDELRRLVEAGEAGNPEHALVIVTHNPGLAQRADRVLRLEAGRLQDVTVEFR
jgi:lipoprotein-releasing system ATP-binding protein